MIPTISLLARQVRAAKRVYLCGNGGSAANAIHIANDLVACGVRAHALTADIATLTAIANDLDYEEVFAQQIKVFCERGDLLIALSGSGASRNVLLALTEAAEIGVTTWAITGAYAKVSPAAGLAKHAIRAGRDMQEAEEEQLRLGHELARQLKEKKR